MIAIVYPQFYGVGGIARYLDCFLANLPANHPTIYMITGDENKLEKQYENVELILLPFSASRFNLFFWTLKVRKILNQLYAQNKIDFVNLHLPPLIPGLFLPKHIPLILTAHTTYKGMSGRFYKKHFYKNQWSVTEINFKLLIERLIFKQARKIITLTEQGRQELLTYGIKNPIEVIPNGVDNTLFQADYTVTKDVDILFCGRIEYRKGSRSMVEVCKSLVQQKNDIRILIVGYGDDDDWVNAKLGGYTKNITITGKVSFSQMRNYYSRSKIYISTSYYEGLPGTCLEAMAMSLPVLVWDFLFYRDLVEHGVTGYLVEPNNVNEMTQIALEILDNDEARLQVARQARTRTQNFYNWPNLSAKIMSVLRS